MMAIAISVPPVVPSIWVMTAVPTRSSVAYLMPRSRMRRACWAAIQRQDVQVNKVAGDVERDHHARAHRQRQRKIAAGILHFAGGEGHIVPGVGGKQRPDLRDGENSQRADQHHRTAHTHLNRMLRAQARVMPEISLKVCRDCLRVAPDQQSQNNQPQQARKPWRP